MSCEPKSGAPERNRAGFRLSQAVVRRSRTHSPGWDFRPLFDILSLGNQSMGREKSKLLCLEASFCKPLLEIEPVSRNVSPCADDRPTGPMQQEHEAGLV